METPDWNTITIQKKNQAFVHIDAEPSILNELVDFFSFQPEGYQFMPSYKNKMWSGYIRIFDSRARQLPIGLYSYVQEFANTRDYKIKLEHNNYYGLPGTNHDYDMEWINDCTFTSRGAPIKHHDYQLAAVEHCLEKRNSLVISPTASGKSFIIYSILRYYLDNHEQDVLIVVPTTSLVKQMNSDFADYSQFDDGFMSDDLCHIIYSGQDKNTKKRITITTWQSIYKLQRTWFERYGCVIVDEAHLATAKSLTSIMSKLSEAEYRFGTTGTIKDGSVKSHRLQLEGHFGKAHYVTTTKKLIDDGTLAGLNINILLVKFPDEECKLIKKMKYPDEIDFIVRHEKRNNFIKNLALDLDGNTLILFQFVDKHGIPLHALIEKYAHERRKIFYVSGKTDADTREDIRKLTESQKNAIIVASLGVFSTGINIRNLHNIIFASPSKSQIKILQSIGRGLRKSDDGRITTVYDIVDDLHWKSHKNYALKHAAERIKIYSQQEFDYKIHEVPLK